MSRLRPRTLTLMLVKMNRYEFKHLRLLKVSRAEWCEEIGIATLMTSQVSPVRLNLELAHVLQTNCIAPPQNKCRRPDAALIWRISYNWKTATKQRKIALEISFHQKRYCWKERWDRSWVRRPLVEQFQVLKETNNDNRKTLPIIYVNF